MASERDWEAVRYRGDAADVHELYEVYRVGHYLDTYDQSQRRRDQRVRDKFLADGIRLTERLSPRVFGIYRSVCRNLGLDTDAEIFCLSSSDVNALAVIQSDDEGSRSLVGVTSGALERLEDGELASVLGHELGHFLFGNHRLNALLNENENNPAATVLPPLGESLFLRWRKKSEISADRVGLLASLDLRSAARGLLKATFGLSDRNINLDVDALLGQIDEIKGSRELMDAAFASHPLLPIRLKALEMFSRSEKAARAGYVIADDVRLSAEVLEDGVDELIKLTARCPDKPLTRAVMRTIALGGVLVLSADGDISEYETKILIEVLHRYFTDEPENEIVAETREAQQEIEAMIQQVNELGDHNDKTFIISRLADVALADGALMAQEGAIVLDLAERLNMSAKTAYNILVAAAEAVGFQVDVKLNRVAEELRRSLRVGYGFAPIDAELR